VIIAEAERLAAPTQHRRRNYSPICECGRQKTEYIKKNGYVELKCRPCQSARQLAKYHAREAAKERVCKIHGIPQELITSRWWCRLCKRAQSDAYIEAARRRRGHDPLDEVQGPYRNEADLTMMRALTVRLEAQAEMLKSEIRYREQQERRRAARLAAHGGAHGFRGGNGK
jgi:hypothetical protein